MEQCGNPNGRPMTSLLRLCLISMSTCSALHEACYLDVENPDSS